MWRFGVLALVGCYSPEISTGAPCTTSRDCPRDLVCAAASRTCERADVDAGVDAPSATGCWRQWLDGSVELGPPSIVAELSSTQNEGNVSLADGDRTVFLSRQAVVFNESDIYVATRSSPGAAFSSPQKLDELSTSATDGRLTVAADGSIAVFASERAGGLGASDLWNTSRTSDGRYSEPTQKIVEALLSTTNQFDPELSPDGLTLYYSQSAFTGQELLVATRPAGAEKFGAPRVLALATPGPIRADPTISPDGRVLVFASGTSSTDLDLYVATRDTASAAFGSPTRLPINSQQADADPELTEDGCALLFSSNRAGSLSRDIWISTVR